MINWTRAFGCALLMGLTACAADSNTTADGGSAGDAGGCLQQLECACTCVCPDGAHRVTYASCIDGVCSDCSQFCNAICS